MKNNRRQFIKTAGSASMMTAAMGLGLAACAGPAQRIVEEHYGLNPTLTALNLPQGVKLGVDRVNVNGIFAGRPVIKEVSTSPLKYEETRSKLWHASPADLIRDAAISGWNNAAGETVALSTATERPKLKLEMDLLTIGYDQSGAGFIAMRARLITDKRKVLIDSRFEAKGASASSLGGTILSIENALEAVLNDIGTAISIAA